MLYNLLPADLAENIFQQLNEEVTWQRMTHQTGEVPRLVCCQGTIDEDGSMPVYRHPSDRTMPVQAWTPTVDRVRLAAEQAVGHTLNHALIQLYRGGTDFISEHSDKTLDITPDSKIVNVSFGAQRTMRFRTKRAAPSSTSPSPSSPLASSSFPPSSPGISGSQQQQKRPQQQQQQRTTFRAPMPHNSLLALSLPTNAEYLHGINPDKRPSVELSEAETAYGGQRISLTFRSISTFLSRDERFIWGRGALGKTRKEAGRVVEGNGEEAEELLKGFGRENAAGRVDWLGFYGSGSDVLHLR